MIADLTDVQREYLLRLLTQAHTELMHELHHAASREFKDRLRGYLAINEELQVRLAPEPARS